MHKQPNTIKQQTLIAVGYCLFVGLLWWFVPHPAVAVVPALLPLMILFVIWKPFLMVLLFVLFSFFRLHEVFPQLYNLKIPLLLSLASLGSLFWHVMISRKITPFWKPELSLFAAFFCLVVVGMILASNRPLAIGYFTGIYWKIGIMTLAIAWLTRSTDEFRLALRLISISGALVSMVAINNKANGIGLVEETRVTIGRELGSVLGDPNDLSLVLMFPAAFSASLILTKGIDRLTWWIGAISVPLLFMAVLATQSRGGLLGMMTVFGIYGYRKIPNKGVFFVVSLVAMIVLYFVAGISDRKSGGAAEEGVDASAMGRLYAWEAAYGMALDHPLLGVGINNFYSNYFFYSPHWDGLNHAVHSTWFGVLAETGFLGLAVFVSMIVMLLRSALNSIRAIEQTAINVPPAVYATSQAVLTGLAGTVVSGTFLTQGFTWPVYILAALVVAVSRWTDLHLQSAKNP